MNLWDIVICAILAAAVVAAIFIAVKRKKKGGCCGCGCDQCKNNGGRNGNSCKKF